MFWQKIQRLGNGAPSFTVQAHPSDARRVVINIPGFNGTIDGYNDKYRTIGEYYSKRGFCAFVQMPNTTRPAGSAYGQGLVADLLATIEWATTHRKRLGVGDDAEICLMGASAGGFAVAHAAPHHAKVKKILLLEPTLSQDLVGEFDPGLLGLYQGECSIIVAAQGIGMPAAAQYKKMLCKASSVRVVELPDCDHQFTGPRNGRIFSKAPAWAFWGEETFPSPEGGLELY